MKSPDALAAQNIVAKSRLAFFEYFAHAADGSEPCFQCGFQAKVYRVVGFAKILPPLGMPDNHMGHAQRHQHRSRNFAGISSVRFPMHILNADSHAGTFCRLNCGMHIGVRRTDHNLIAAVSRNQRQKFAKEVASFIRRFVHLPIRGKQLLSHDEAFSIWNGESGFEQRKVSAARSYSLKVPASKSTNRTFFTWLADARASTVEEIAMAAACETG